MTYGALPELKGGCAFSYLCGECGGEKWKAWAHVAGEVITGYGHGPFRAFENLVWNLRRHGVKNAVRIGQQYAEEERS